MVHLSAILLLLPFLLTFIHLRQTIRREQVCFVGPPPSSSGYYYVQSKASQLLTTKEGIQYETNRDDRSIQSSFYGEEFYGIYRPSSSSTNSRENGTIMWSQVHAPELYHDDKSIGSFYFRRLRPFIKYLSSSRAPSAASVATSLQLALNKKEPVRISTNGATLSKKCAIRSLDWIVNCMGLS